jgi:hypothetical protein
MLLILSKTFEALFPKSKKEDVNMHFLGSEIKKANLLKG